MKLQIIVQLSTGETWADRQDRFDEFVGLAAKHHGHTTDQIINDGLLQGKIVPFNYFGSIIRMRDADSVEPVQVKTDSRPVLTCSVCGQTGHSGGYPFSTTAGICDDCV